MAFVVTEPCVKCKFTDCVSVCPVDCFREGENMLVIAPDECIDCQACVPACPVNAIFFEDDVPADQQSFIALNRRLSEGWPAINKAKAHPADAEQFRAVKAKRHLVSERPGR